MAYTVSKLVLNAYYLSGVVSRRSEVPSGMQTEDGLLLLNEILDTKYSEPEIIPYWQIYDGEFDIGEEKYFIENLIDIETATFNIGTVRYPLQFTARDQYFGSARIDSIQSLPYSYYFERTKGGSDFYVYFTPVGEYPFKIVGKFGLVDVILSDDLEETYDGFYINYLKYALAAKICEWNTVQFQAASMETLKEYEKKLRHVSPPDFSMEKVSSLQLSAAYNFGDINIGRGWRPA